MTKLALQDAGHRVTHKFVTWTSTRPGIYYPLNRLTGRFNERCVTQETDIVIEGYPRSANSTTAHEFIARQNAPVHVAHHKHHAAQLLRAVEWKLPAVVLIRKPIDSILSYLALEQERLERRGPGVYRRGSALNFEDATLSWVSFYSALLPVLDNIVIAPFQEVTKDIVPMIEAVNARFGTEFDSLPTEKSQGLKLGFHARPNELRNGILARLRDEFDETIKASPRLAELYAQTDPLHERYLARHSRGN